MLLHLGHAFIIMHTNLSPIIFIITLVEGSALARAQAITTISVPTGPCVPTTRTTPESSRATDALNYTIGPLSTLDTSHGIHALASTYSSDLSRETLPSSDMTSTSLQSDIITATDALLLSSLLPSWGTRASISNTSPATSVSTNR